MKSLIKNKVLFLILSFIMVFLFSSSQALAADPIGCCRFDQYDNKLYGWEPKARYTTALGCGALNNPNGNPKTDALGFYLNRIPKIEGGYAWCEKQAPDIDSNGCCYWEEQNRLGGVPQPHSKDMKQSECEGRKGYETADANRKNSVAWYLGGTAGFSQPSGGLTTKTSLPICKPATAPTGGGNPTSGTQGGSCPTGGGNCGPTSTFSGSFSNLNNPLGTYSIPVLIGRIIRALLDIVGSLALIMFVAGGLMWMTSAGNEKRVAAGKNTLIWAAIGLAVIFFAYIIVKFVLETVGAQ